MSFHFSSFFMQYEYPLHGITEEALLYRRCITSIKMWLCNAVVCQIYIWRAFDENSCARWAAQRPRRNTCTGRDTLQRNDVLYFPSDLVKIGHVMNQILKKWLGQINKIANIRKRARVKQIETHNQTNCDLVRLGATRSNLMLRGLDTSNLSINV